MPDCNLPSVDQSNRLPAPVAFTVNRAHWRKTMTKIYQLKTPPKEAHGVETYLAPPPPSQGSCPEHVETLEKPGGGVRRLLSIVFRDELPKVLRYLLDETEFLSPFGIRAVSNSIHRTQPYILQVHGTAHRVDYEPAESSTWALWWQFELARAPVVPW